MEKEKPDYDNVRRYALARAGHQIFEQDPNAGKKALDGLVEKLYGENNDDISGLLAGSRSSRESVEKALGVYAQKDRERRYGVEIKNLPDLYEAQFNSLVEEEDREEARKIFDYDGDYKSVMREYKEAENILKNKELYEKEKIEEAEKTLMKYQRLVAFVSTLEAEELEGLINPLAKKSRKEQIKKMIYG